VIAGSDLSKPNPDLQIHSWVSPARRAKIANRLQLLIESGRVVFHRWLDAERLRSEIYPKADAFVMPTHAEGFGFTNIEAMSFGLPVISSTAGPTEEIVGDNRAGLLVAPGAVDQLADAMHRLASDSAFARGLGQAGREAFLTKFTTEHFRVQLGNLYHRALMTS
jgi:glycosyltransferase involved in cell wall biosynthesis